MTRRNAVDRQAPEVKASWAPMATRNTDSGRVADEHDPDPEVGLPGERVGSIR